MKTKLMLNTTMSLLLQITTVICGFILPRLMLEYYGSEVNGLIQSIAQFLYIISFLELGVGQVIQSSLYKPLINNNLDQISKILKSGSKYFRTIALVIVGYIIVLCLLSQYIFQGSYDIFYTTTLIVTIGISSFAQYYFGLVDKIFLNSDQKGYIQFTVQVMLNIFNIIIVSYLIRQRYSLQFVKLVSAIIFLLSPIIIRLYINRNYKINRRIKYSEEPIKQKWNGVAQHISTVVLEGTDIIILTLFSTLSNVSIYSVYYMVISGVRQMYTSATSGVQSMVGALWAKNDKERFESVFQSIEIILHSVVTFLFSCVYVLMIPFVEVYTQGINDCNYIQPIFAAVLIIAYAIRCLRTPYNILILAGGHFKQTQNCHIVSAILNVSVSLILVSFYGLIGIAVGTLVAYTYQTLWMIFYNSKNLLHWPMQKVLKQVITDIFTAVLIFFSTGWIEMEEISYFGWFKMAILVALIGFVITVAISTLFFFSKFKTLFRLIKR